MIYTFRLLLYFAATMRENVKKKQSASRSEKVLYPACTISYNILRLVYYLSLAPSLSLSLSVPHKIRKQHRERELSSKLTPYHKY